MSFKSSTFIGALLLLVGCADKLPQELRDARAAYERASQDPDAERLTPAQLYEAQQSLELAERIFKEQGATADARDRAYVALRKAELAAVLARTAKYTEAEASARAKARQASEARAAATRAELSETRTELAAERADKATTEAQLEAERARRAEAERRASEAAASLAKVASVKEEERGTVVTLSGSVLFASGKSELLPAARSRLTQVANALVAGDPGAMFVVEGHTDSSGSPELNQRLSEERAQAVREFLVAHGVPAERIDARGLGPTQPVADNSTAEGRANNRRVEIVIKPSA